jgi:hypothetical protein
MAYRDRLEDPTTAEAIEKLRLDTLRPLAKLVDPDAPTRKQDLVPYLADRLRREDVVRRLYESLDETNRAAVQEALKSPAGRLDSGRFEAKYGRRPVRGTERSPTALGLLLLSESAIPRDLRPILSTFVPEPRALAISGAEEPPETVPDPFARWANR